MTKEDTTVEEFLKKNESALLTLYMSGEDFDEEVYSETFLFFLLSEGFLGKKDEGGYYFTDVFRKFVLNRMASASSSHIGTGQPLPLYRTNVSSNAWYAWNSTDEDVAWVQPTITASSDHVITDDCVVMVGHSGSDWPVTTSNWRK